MQIGTYEVLRELGRGGMGTVYLARSLGPGGVQRLVAIKRPHEQRTETSEASDRFLEEARIAAQIHHANVVGMHQAGTDDDGYFLVFDYVEGESLGELVERAWRRGERIPAPIVLRIVLDALAGLHAAHEARGSNGEALGILHRDVSPQNLLVGRDGVARLSDFGIAKITSSAIVTDQGYVRGKFVFMSPEYLQRLPVDRTVDVYAMGITLWVALADTGLWDGYDEPQLLRAILLEGVPRLTGVPEALADIVNVACRSDAGQRFQTARQMLETLEAAGIAIGASATHFDVAEYLERVAGPELNARRESIAAAPAPDVDAQKPRDTRPRGSRAVFAYAALALAAPGALFLAINRSPVPVSDGGSEAPHGATSGEPALAAARERLSAKAPARPEPAAVRDSGAVAPAQAATSHALEKSAPATRERKAPAVAASARGAGAPSGAPSNAPFLPFDPNNPYR
jgi:serine/threonine-protein kinase